MNRPQRANSNRTVGVIVCMKNKNQIPPFFETEFYRQLAEEAAALQLNLIVFNPKEVDWSRRRVKAWFFHPSKRWISKSAPLPNLIYDRCHYVTHSQYKKYQPYVKRLQNDPEIRLLGRALGGKIQTHEILQKNELIAEYLPETEFYTSPDTVQEMLRKHHRALIKPNGGSHGIGVVGISEEINGYTLRGRDQKNQPFRKFIFNWPMLAKWLKGFIGNNRYVVQQYLPLVTKDGNPFDIRTLLQKNENQTWVRTGLAVRMGKPSSITSNLHGGGKAKKIEPFLEENFSTQQIKEIWKQIDLLSQSVPQFIESNHGPLVELGLDLGIDPDGKIWILEVNSKPGRSVFLRIGDLKTRRRAIQLPMLYANSLLSRQLGGIT